MTKRMMTMAIAAFVAAAVVAVLAAVYGNIDPEGNRTASICNGSEERIARIDGNNVGQVAAFQPADQARYVGDLVWMDEAGKETGLADHRGQTILLNLWATWCAPCREEMPALAQLQLAMGSDAFQVVPVSMDSGEADKPLNFYRENDLSALPFRHDGTIATFNTLRKMGIAIGMPTTILVDAMGCAIGWMNGPADWASADAKRLIGAIIR